MKECKVFLKPKKEESLLRFHPWVFSGAIQTIEGEPEEGDLVEVYGTNGRFLGIGHYQIGSIAVRILSFKPVTIDAAFWEERIRIAYTLRQALELAGVENNNTYRLVHGEGDNLPGLVIDIYAKTAVMQAHSAGMHVDRMAIAEALSEVMGDKIENIYYKSETTLPFKADLFPENGFLKGGSTDNIAREYGLQFHVDWLKGQKTGFFVDQRENRALLERYAKDRSVLNMFCYTGGFSFYAMRGGAKLVHSVDSSSKAIDLTNKNVGYSWFYHSGPAQHKRHTYSSVIHHRLPTAKRTCRTVFTNQLYCLVLISIIQHRTVIARQYYNRIFCQSQPVQFFQKLINTPISFENNISARPHTRLANKTFIRYSRHMRLMQAIIKKKRTLFIIYDKLLRFLKK